jgi:hypothetical protein
MLLNRYQQVSLSDLSFIPQIRGRIALVQKNQVRSALFDELRNSVAKAPEADDPLVSRHTIVEVRTVVAKTRMKPNLHVQILTLRRAVPAWRHWCGTLDLRCCPLRTGHVPSIFVSVIAVLCLQYSFAQPIFSLRADKPVDVVAVIVLEICVLTPEKAALGRTEQAPISCRGSGRAHHSPSILSTKRQRSSLMFANQSSGEGRPTSAF